MTARSVLLIASILGVVCAPVAGLAGADSGGLLGYRVLVADYSKTSGGCGPALSPDGKVLAYMSSAGDIWLLRCDPNGDGPAVVPWKLPIQPQANDGLKPSILDQGVARNIEWSPDGKRLAFGYRNGRLCIADNFDYGRQTANVRVLGLERPFNYSKAQAFRLGSPRWSPDGKKIAYLRENPKDANTYSVCVVDPATEKETVLARDAVAKGLAWGQPWSPDGRELVYSSLSQSKNGVRKAGISIVTVDGKGRKQLAVPEGSSCPSWSSNGRIAFVADKNIKVPVATGVDAGISTSVVWVCDGKGGNARVLSKPLSAVERNLSAMTAAARAQFRSAFKGRLASHLTSDQRKRLASGSMSNDEICDLLWLVPGKVIGGEFRRCADEFVRLNKAHRTGKNVDLKTLQDASDAALAALPPGKVDWFVRSSFGIVYDVSSRIWQGKYGSDKCPVWSPDGKKLLFVRTGAGGDTEALVVMNVQTGQEKSVYSAGHLDCVSWTRDGRSVIAQTRRLMALKRPGADGEANSDSVLSAGMTTATPGYPEIWVLQLEPNPKRAASGAANTGGNAAPVAEQSADPALALELKKIYISPSRVGLQPGGTQRFRVFGIDAVGREVPLESSGVWLSDPETGAIDSYGVFTAGNKQGVHDSSIKVWVGRLEARATVEVLPKTVQGDYVLERTLGGLMPGVFSMPWGIAVDRSDCTYVADFGNRCVQKLDANGTALGMWRASYQGRDLPVLCETVAVGPDGSVYVGSGGGVYKFDRSGKVVGVWDLDSAMDSADGNAISWNGIPRLAADGAGNVYVVNGNANRIEKHDASGKLLGIVGSAGLGDGQIGQPDGLAVDANGFVYVADSRNRKILKFNANGEFVTEFGSNGKDEGELFGPMGIAVYGTDRIYVLSDGGCHVKAFSGDGKYVGEFGGHGESLGCIQQSNSIAVDTQGNVLVSDVIRNKVIKYDSSGKMIAEYGLTGALNGCMREPNGIATDPAGNLYVTDNSSGAVQKFDSSGSYITKWASRGTFLNLTGVIQVDSNGMCYLGMHDGINEFDTAVGPPLFEVVPSMQPQGRSIRDAVITSSGTVYAIISTFSRMSSDGVYTLEKREPGGGWVVLYDSKQHPGEELDSAARIALDSDGAVYVAGMYWTSVIRLLPDGKLEKRDITTIGGEKVVGVSAIDIDDTGNVFVAGYSGTDTCHILKLDRSGRTVASFTPQGFRPSRIRVAADGRIYAIGEQGNSNVYVYMPVKQ